MYTVGIRKRFPFRFHSMVILWCEHTLNYGVKSLLRSRKAYHFYGFEHSEFLNAHSGCILRPTLLYLGYVLGPGSLSLLIFGVHSFYRTGDTAAVRSITAETPPTKPKLLELAYPWRDLADFLIQ